MRLLLKPYGAFRSIRFFCPSKKLDVTDSTVNRTTPKGQHFFGTATVGERGQIVIPKKAREIFQINPGDSVIIIGDEDRGLALAPEKMIKQFLNMVKAQQKEEE